MERFKSYWELVKERPWVVLVPLSLSSGAVLTYVGHQRILADPHDPSGVLCGIGVLLIGGPIIMGSVGLSERLPQPLLRLPQWLVRRMR